MIPPKRNRNNPHDYDRDLYQACHLIKNFFAKLKQYRAISISLQRAMTNALQTF
ncbi:hypothetical protein [Nostoc sp.]|uniref:hypothetical protein n=1 Tax=Nostoc sp. TaxID=1180 RepID=UPI002FF6D52F